VVCSCRSGDGTCGRPGGAYGAGRYLTDTVKGTFGRGVTVLADDRVRLDFNCAYNPSCAYDDRWACPLAPEENRLTSPIEAGERAYHMTGCDSRRRRPQTQRACADPGRPSLTSHDAPCPGARTGAPS
jgi:hypothetical protein